MDRYWETKELHKQHPDKAILAVTRFLDDARYLDGATVKFSIDGENSGECGTVESLTYKVQFKYLVDCITY